MPNWNTCHKGKNDSFAAAVIIKTKQINHQYGYVCGMEQLYCIVNWSPQTYFKSVKPEKLKISHKLPLIDILPILLALFSNGKLKLELFSPSENFYFIRVGPFPYYIFSVRFP